LKSKALLTAILPLLLLSGSAYSQQPGAAAAVDLERKGDYVPAAQALEKLVDGGNTTPVVVEALYYAWIRPGEYARALERFESWTKTYPNSGAIQLAAGRVNNIVGNYSRALALFDLIQNSQDVGPAARYEKATVLAETGKRDQADAIYQKLIGDFKSGVVSRTPDLLYVARSLRAIQNLSDSNDVFKFIAKSDPKNAEAFVAWGDLLSDTTNEAEAVLSYQDALAIDPNMPEALLGMARNLSDDPENAEKAFNRVREFNPKNPEANLLAANQTIDSEEYTKALENIDKVLAVNPQSTAAISLVATINYLQGNTEKYNQAVQKVLQINPLDNELYYSLASNCVSLRLYKQAADFAMEAVRLNPSDWQSMTVMGVNLLRIGQEDAGKAALERAYAMEKAFAGNAFDEVTVNTLRLTDSWKDFDRITTPHFRVKLSHKESAALRPYVTDLLEKAYKDLSAKYDFTPEGPIDFEMYPDHADFEVRATGLTGLGALGVCFGKLLVLDSPSARPPDTFNWGSTLWHEFTHVITLQITDHKIPRWFSEGLSVYEERQEFPGWGDRMKLSNLLAIETKDPKRRFLPIALLNNGFIFPIYDGQVQVSYYQASMVAEYIATKWGFPAIRKMLLLYKAGKSTADVFKEGLNVSLDQFDTEFTKWIDDKAAAIDPEQYHKLTVEGGMALEAGDFDKAIKSLTAAVAIYPEYTDDSNAYEPLVQAYLHKGDKANEMATLKKLLENNETNYPAYVRLSQLLSESGDDAGAARYMEAAMYVRPMDLAGHEKLGQLMLGLKSYPKAEREYETLLALNSTDRAGAYYHLAEAEFADGRRDDAKKNVLESLKIAPSYAPALDLLLKVR